MVGPGNAKRMEILKGELRFRNTLYMDRAYPSQQQITELLYTTVYTTDDYLPGILQVNDGIAPKSLSPPWKVYQQIRGSDEPHRRLTLPCPAGRINPYAVTV